MAAVFKDTRGREWDLSLTLLSIRRIREAAGGSVLKKNDRGEWKWLRLPFDTELFGEVLWAIVEPVALTRGVTREDFEESVRDETFAPAAAAWYEAVSNFSPTPEVNRQQMGTGEEMIRLITSSITSSGDGNLPDSSASSPLN